VSMANIEKAIHEELGAEFAPFEGEDLPASYGDPAAEHRAVREAAGVLDRSHRSRLVIAGPDSVPFAQNLVTSDVSALEEGKGQLSALLTPKGKLVTDLRIHHRGDHLLVDYPAEMREAIVKKLTMFILGSKVEVEDITEMLSLLSVHGPKAREVLGADGLPEVPYASAMIGVGGLGITACRTDDLGEEGWDLHFPVAAFGDVMKVLRKAGAKPIGWRAAETLRIEAGVARFGAELDDRLLAPEVPAFAERAVSYEKGCYVGQETLARIRTYGHVNRELRGLVVEGDETPEPGATLRGPEDKKAGEVTSACVPPTLGRPIALAFVKRGMNDSGAAVEIEHGDGRIAAKVVPPGGPWE